MSENASLTNKKTWDVILNRTKDYYKNNEEILEEQARNKYRNLSEEEEKKNMGTIDTAICLMKRNKD